MRQWRKRNLSELLYARAGLEFVCLSIPKHAWYYPVVWHPLIHRTVLLSRHHNLKTVTLELSCALEYTIRVRHAPEVCTLLWDLDAGV